MRVLVTGATGALGPATLAACADAGFAVRALVRRPGAGLPPGITAMTGDVTDAPSLERAVAGVDAVVHLAALLHVIDPPPTLRDEYHRVNVEGTHALVEAAARAGVRRLALASTTAVYGPTATVADEETPPAPDSWYASSKVAAEAAVREAHRPGTFGTTVLRLSAVYGPRIKGNYQRLLHALAAGRYVPIGPGTNRRSLVHEADAARALVTAIAHPAAAGRTYNVTDGTPHPLHAIVRAMCHALGRPEPRVSLPVAPTRALVATIERVARLAGVRPPIASATLAKYLEDSVVDGRRLQRELDFTARWDLERGWQATVEAMRAAGTLPPGGTR